MSVVGIGALCTGPVLTIALSVLPPPPYPPAGPLGAAPVGSTQGVGLVVIVVLCVGLDELGVDTDAEVLVPVVVVVFSKDEDADAGVAVVR